jgi:hypothetical protein
MAQEDISTVKRIARRYGRDMGVAAALYIDVVFSAPAPNCKEAGYGR